MRYRLGATSVKSPLVDISCFCPSFCHLFALVCVSEEKQQTSLTEWCNVRGMGSRKESHRERSAGSSCLLHENDLLDDGGDGVFNQHVR